MILAILLSLSLSHAHPMDLGGLDVQLLESRMKVKLRLHQIAAEKLAPLSDSEKMFSATLGNSKPTFKGAECEWRKPDLHVAADDKNYVELESVAVCMGVQRKDFGVNMPLPFLKNMSPIFQLISRVTFEGGGVTTIVSTAAKPELLVGDQDLKGFAGFLRMGMGHIGALPGEWKSADGKFQFPEGLDHIFFVLALVLGGGSILGLLKCVSGFTFGHSLTLALSTLKIIHVHSRWVEAFIALSIAYVAAAAVLRPKSPHRWRIAALFGTVHGLGFASALQELELPRGELWNALLGFNLGVELGQCVIVLATFPLLFLLKRFSTRGYVWTHRAAGTALFLVGTYWFLQRAIN